MISMATIEAMSKAERLMAIDLIWSTLSDADKDVPSPAWHEEVLAARLEKVNRGEATFLTLEQAKERLAAKPSP
jgi:hypothetical protein